MKINTAGRQAEQTLKNGPARHREKKMALAEKLQRAGRGQRSGSVVGSFIQRFQHR